ncbi:MAG: hypothetical protein C0483_02410 [Pirellula sp.]|nr:hypothetical protein [Pirellula sp.]
MDLSLPVAGAQAVAALFAQNTWMRSSGASLQGSDYAWRIAALIAVGALGWWAATTMRGRDRRPNLYQPRKLFDELCKLHRLQRNEIMLLHTLAKERRLDTPGLLFVHPEYFQPTNDREEEGYSEALAELRLRLFGDDVPKAA